MEENKMKVCVEVSVVDGKFQFDISAHKSLTIEDIRSILVGGVCLTIHGEKTPKDQGRVLREVIEHMEEDFIDIDSFKDVVFPKHDPPSENK
jgi:hypothetical protein